MRTLVVVLLLLLAVALAACGGEATEEGAGGDPVAGEQVYTQISSPTCASCHSVEAGVTLVGPSLAGVSDRYPTAEDLRHAIVAPNDTIAGGFSPNIMPTTYESQLTEQQMNDLIAYLQTL